MWSAGITSTFISKLTIGHNPLTVSGWSGIRGLRWISEISWSDHVRPSVQGCLKSDGQTARPARPVHQQITLFWTVLDSATQSHRVPSLVHAGQLCPDRHRLWTSVEVCTALPSSPQMYRIISKTSPLLNGH